MPAHTKECCPVSTCIIPVFLQTVIAIYARRGLAGNPTGVIVWVACLMRLMKVATRWVHWRLAHRRPVITSRFFLFSFHYWTAYWEEQAHACHLPSLSFDLLLRCCTPGIIDLLTWKWTINCVNGVRSLAHLQIIYQSQSSSFLPLQYFHLHQEDADLNLCASWSLEGLNASNCSKETNKTKPKNHEWRPLLNCRHIHGLHMWNVSIFVVFASAMATFSSVFHLPK